MINPSAIGEMDRISQLPESIVHHILSFLDYSPVDLVRTSVLSKKWFALTASFPKFDFHIHEFTQILDVEVRHKKDKFIKYVDYTISRFCEQNVSAYSFKLMTVVEEPINEDIVNRWIGLIVKKNVQVLDLTLQDSKVQVNRTVDFKIVFEGKYRLPKTVLSAMYLTSLTLNDCEWSSSLMVDGVKFRSLKVLSLYFVSLDDEVAEYLISGCPLLEEIYIRYCDLKTFCVKGLQNLQKVVILYEDEFERMNIEAPNLEFLCLVNTSDETVAPLHVNVALCKKLTTLLFETYDCGESDEYEYEYEFADLLSNFLFIENLSLRIRSHLLFENKVKFSSHSLRKFMLYGLCDFDDIEINAPNLILFQYYANMPDECGFYFSLELEKCMEYYIDDVVCTLYFESLRRFLDKHGFKVLKLYINKASMEDIDELKKTEVQPFELEHVHLELEYMEDSMFYVPVVDAVFWCCCPRSLTLGFNFAKGNDLLKHTYEKLLQQVDEGLTNIQIVLTSGSKTKKEFNNLNSLLTELPSYGDVQITLTKEKRL